MATYPCPVCLAEANLETGCPACGRAPDPLAAEVIALDTTIARLAHEVDAAREAYEGKAAELRTTRDRRRDLALRVWQSAHPAPVATGATPYARPVPQLSPQVAAGAAARPEARTQTVKNILFVLGGLLVAVSAAVFTVFAWGTFGMAGRTTILAAVTGLALASPIPTQRRGLRGTAETFAALGLVLVLLDGYAAWHVNLAGVADRMGGWAYAGLVFGPSAVLAGLYARATGLRAPAYFGWVAMQPVLPMLFSGAVAGHGGLVFAGVAALNLPLTKLVRDRVLAVLAWVGFGSFLFLAHLYAIVRLLSADTLPVAGRAAAIVLVIGVVALAGSFAAGRIQFGIAWFTVLFVACWVRLADLLAPGHALVWTAALVCVLAMGFAVVNRPLAAAGVIGWTVVIGLIAAAGALARGVLTISVAAPWWSGTPAGGRTHGDLVLTVVLATVAAVALSVRRLPLVATGASALGLGLLAQAAPGLAPGSAALPPAADLAALAILLGYLVAIARGTRYLVAVSRGTGNLVAIPAAVIGAALFGHALLTAMISPLVSACSFAALVVLTVAVAALTIRVPSQNEATAQNEAAAQGEATAQDAVTAQNQATAQDRVRKALHATAVAVTAPMLVLTAAAVAKSLAANASTVLHTAALAALVLPALARLLRRGAVTAWATTLAMVFVGVLAVPADPWAKSFYVAGGLLVLLLDGHRERRVATWSALAVALVLARPPISALAGGPATFADAAACAVLVLGISLHAYAVRGDRRLALGSAVALAPLPVTFALVAAEVPRQTIAGLLSVAGLVIVVVALLRARLGGLRLVAAAYGVALVATGLPGLMITPWWTVAGLGLVTVSFTVLAVAAGHTVTRWAAWPLAGLGLLATGQAAGWAARFSGHDRLLILVGTALLLLAVGVLGPRRLLWVEAVSLEAVGHVTAAGALVSAYTLGVTSQVLLVWGVAVGLTALALPRWRLRRGAVAVGLELAAWWSLLAERDVVTVEAYSLPAALAGLGLGWWAMRRDPSLSSWAGYAPGLLAGLLPSLSLAIAGEGEPLRRLGVGLAGLVLVIAGSVRRRQAPVVLGGAALILLALHELVLAWTNLGRPVWLPIGAGGAILLAIAITYERRLRDLRTLRARIGGYR